MEPLVSIIIPVYNVAPYLERCLESILNQTYRNYEMIIVNDGSTDDSLAICKRYAQKYKHIKLYDQSNQGVSETRNFGFSKTKGEFICFIDADDFVSNIYIEILLKNIRDTNADISICNSTKSGVFDENNEVVYEKWNSEDTIIQFLQYKAIDATIWGKLYRKSVLEKLKFKRIKIGEDQIYLLQAIENSRAVVYTSIRLYCYFSRPSSAMEAPFDKRFWDVIYMAEWFGKEGSLRYPKLEDLFYKKEIYSYVVLSLIAFKFSTEESEKIIKFIKPRIKKSNFLRIRGYCTRTEKYTYLLVKHMFDIVKILYKYKAILKK